MNRIAQVWRIPGVGRTVSGVVSDVVAVGGAVQQQVVDMYLSEASIADIKAAAGTTDIYTLLRNAGVEPGRSPRRRGRILAMAKQEAADALVAAASDLDGSDSLTLAGYMASRDGSCNHRSCGFKIRISATILATVECYSKTMNRAPSPNPNRCNCNDL